MLGILSVRIYEDNAARILGDEKSAVMSTNAEEAQQTLKTDTETLRHKTEQQERQNQNLELLIRRFVSMRICTNWRNRKRHDP